jgi:hypothetical protein
LYSQPNSDKCLQECANSRLPCSGTLCGLRTGDCWQDFKPGEGAAFAKYTYCLPAHLKGVSWAGGRRIGAGNPANPVGSPRRSNLDGSGFPFLDGNGRIGRCSRYPIYSSRQDRPKRGSSHADWKKSTVEAPRHLIFPMATGDSPKKPFARQAWTARKKSLPLGAP